MAGEEAEAARGVMDALGEALSGAAGGLLASPAAEEELGFEGANDEFGQARLLAVFVGGGGGSRCGRGAGACPGGRGARRQTCARLCLIGWLCPAVQALCEALATLATYHFGGITSPGACARPAHTPPAAAAAVLCPPPPPLHAALVRALSPPRARPPLAALPCL